MALLARRLRSSGFATLNVGYGSRQKPLDGLAEEIHQSIAIFAGEGDGPVHFVAHSMGGLVARVYLARHRPARLSRVVMLGPPNGGSEVADALCNRAFYRLWFGPAGSQLTTDHAAVLNGALAPIDYPLGIIAGCRSINPLFSALLLKGPSDGKVTVERTKLAGMTDHLVVRVNHSWLPLSRVCADETVAFLTRGRFGGTHGRCPHSITAL